MAEEAAVLDVESTPGDQDPGGATPEGSSPSPGRREPPEKNQLGEMKRLMKRYEQRIKQLEAGASQKSKADEALTRIREAVTGTTARADAIEPPDPDAYYEDPAGYKRALERWADAKADQRFDARIQSYDRTRKTQEVASRQDELNGQVTEQFVQSRPWLQNEDGTPNEEALKDFQAHINTVGIEGRGPAGSLTLRQLEAAERDYRFDDLMSAEGSRIQGDMVQNLRDRGRAATPRGQGTNVNVSIDKMTPREQVATLRQLYELDGEAAMMRAFEKIPSKDRDKLMPLLRGVAR